MRKVEINSNQCMTGVKLKLFNIPDDIKQTLFKYLGYSDYVQKWAIDAIGD